jgi:hypothetical protein
LSAIAQTRLALADSGRYITVENPDITQGGLARSAPSPRPAGFRRQQGFQANFTRIFL